MIRMLLASALAAAVVSSPPCRTRAHGRVDDPPLNVMLTIDGIDVRLTDGVPAEVRLADRTIPVVARVLPVRRFAEHGLSFEFPRDMTYEFDPSGDVETWTLDGGNCTILLNRYAGLPVESLVEAVFDGTVSRFGGAGTKKDAVAWRLGTVPAKGYSQQAIVLSAATMQITVLGLQHGKDAWVVVVQDTLNDEKRPTEESKRVKALLETSFALATK